MTDYIDNQQSISNVQKNVPAALMRRGSINKKVEHRLGDKSNTRIYLPASYSAEKVKQIIDRYKKHLDL